MTVDPAATAFAEAWLTAIGHASFVPGGPTRTRAVLAGLALRLCAAARAEPFDPAAGYSVGADLVAANISAPRALGRSLTLLSERLTHW